LGRKLYFSKLNIIKQFRNEVTRPTRNPTAVRSHLLFGIINLSTIIITRPIILYYHYYWEKLRRFTQSVYVTESIRFTHIRHVCGFWFINSNSNTGLTYKGKGNNSPTTYQWGRKEERMYSSYSFRTSALDGGWVVSVMLWPRFNPGERTAGILWTEGWVVPRASLDTEDRGKISCLCWGSNLDRPVVQSVARHYTDWATPALGLSCINVNNPSPFKYNIHSPNNSLVIAIKNS
jgi:hypothetical protein